MRKWCWLASALVLGGLFSPPTSAADVPTKKELQTAANNLKQIGIAFHNHAGNNREKFPDDITDKDGRVRVLPGALAEQGGADGFFVARFRRG